MEEKAAEIVYTVVGLGITAVAVVLVEWVRRRIGVEGMLKIQEEIGLKKELALLAIKFVEQAFRQHKGRQKFDLAAGFISEQAEKLGLQISAREIKVLVEWAVRTMKDEFGENWGEVTKTNDRPRISN